MTSTLNSQIVSDTTDTHPLGEGTQRIVEFKNGYSASIIKTPFSYGGPKLAELAVLHNGDLDYSTPITDDVIGHLSDAAIEPILQSIAELPAK